MNRFLPSIGPCLVILELTASLASAADSPPAPAQPGRAEQAPPGVIRGPWCVTFSEPENSTQAKLISKMRLQEAERSAQREADLEAIFAERALLDSRDLSPIAKAAAAKDVRKLWLFFDLASIADQGVKGGSQVSAQQSFNRLVLGDASHTQLHALRRWRMPRLELWQQRQEGERKESQAEVRDHGGVEPGKKGSRKRA